MKEEVSVKQDHIVEAAIKRFTHFGINKTTLGEIAEDIGISKASLFYYFQDKGTLLEAVGQKIINEVLEGFNSALSSVSSVEDGLLALIEVKRQFFKKYMMLALQSESVEMNKLSPQFTHFIQQSHLRKERIVSDFLKRGIEAKTLRPLDTEKTARLLLETLQAFDHCIKGKSPFLQNLDMDALFDKQKDVMQILLNGLKSNEWKN
ncbi:MAG: TetR/AcrR family transcriptional regulator [Daejeonella sp.]|uniref:TetR/AcrR family transcriptional regulator n=1 Tax=unclassified Daejeonella TaxID=2805396 RepID=UPI0023EDFF2E|nr:TetR/AcrR family transcriptional regulator [Daejeonella sp. JGW-45]